MHIIILVFLAFIVLAAIWRAFLHPGEFFSTLGRVFLGGIGLLGLLVTAVGIYSGIRAPEGQSAAVAYVTAGLALAIALLCRFLYKKISY